MDGKGVLSPTKDLADGLGIPLSDLQAMADSEGDVFAPGVAASLKRPLIEVAAVFLRFGA